MLFVLVQSFAVISQRQIEYNSSNNIKLVRSVHIYLIGSDVSMAIMQIRTASPQFPSACVAPCGLGGFVE